MGVLGCCRASGGPRACETWLYGSSTSHTSCSPLVGEEPQLPTEPWWAWRGTKCVQGQVGHVYLTGFEGNLTLLTVTFPSVPPPSM